MKTRFVPLGVPLLVLAAAACSESTAGRVALALSSRPAPGPALAAAPAVAGRPTGSVAIVAAGDSTVMVAGNDTLVIRSVELVLRKIELERVETAECDEVMDNGDCEEFETGPVLVSLPLGASATATQVAVDAPPGMYNELEFEIHKPDEIQDAAFIVAHPSFADTSIRVTGTFSKAGTRTDFTFTSDLNEAQEIALDPPLTVSEGSTTNVTLRLDIARWFVNSTGDALVDPASANKGQPNENLVRDNIRASIDAFRDDDRDGLDDDHEDS